MFKSFRLLTLALPLLFSSSSSASSLFTLSHRLDSIHHRLQNLLLTLEHVHDQPTKLQLLGHTESESNSGTEFDSGLIISSIDSAGYEMELPLDNVANSIDSDGANSVWNSSTAYSFSLQLGAAPLQSDSIKVKARVLDADDHETLFSYITIQQNEYKYNHQISVWPLAPGNYEILLKGSRLDIPVESSTWTSFGKVLVSGPSTVPGPLLGSKKDISDTWVQASLENPNQFAVGFERTVPHEASGVWLGYKRTEKNMESGDFNFLHEKYCPTDPMLAYPTYWCTVNDVAPGNWTVFGKPTNEIGNATTALHIGFVVVNDPVSFD